MSPATATASSSSSSSDLIDSRVSPAQLQKAVTALCAHAQKSASEASKTELIERDDHVWLTVATKKISSVKKLKPARVALPNPVIDPRTTSICLFTKDPQRQYKDLLEAQNIKYVSRVVGIEKLKGKFKPFEARRQLMNDHGLFLVDERVVPLLPKLLGTKFFKAKKQPIPVNLTRKDLKAELERAIMSTSFHHSPGNSHSIRIAALPPSNSTTPAKVLANLAAAIPQVAKLIPGGWDNVSALNIKTTSSVALPIWVADASGRWTGMEDVEVEDEVMSDASEEDGEKVEAPAPVKKSKAPAPKSKKAASTDAALVAPAPPHPAPAPSAPSKDELKKKSLKPVADNKKKVSGAAAGKKSIKESVVGKKGSAKAAKK